MPSTVHIDANRTWGGGQEQSLGLALALAERGHPTAFFAQSGSALAARLSSTRLPWEALPMRGAHQPRAALLLARRLRRLRPDIVHCHDSAGQAPAAFAARRAGRLPLIVTRRTASPPGRGPLHQHFYKSLCVRIICVSQAVRQQCLAAGIPPTRLVVIPDFVDCAHFDPDALPGRPDPAHPLVVTVGRLSREKGHDVLLRSVPMVAAAVPQARFRICGTGPEEGRLRQLTDALNIADRVDFAGFVPDIRVAVAPAAVFAMPSRSEGLGVAVLEAMAMGKPVVASDVGGLRESVCHGETGLRVAPEDPQALAEGLVALLCDPARASRMGAAGRARAVERYDRARIVDRILALYDEVLAGGSGCPV